MMHLIPSTAIKTVTYFQQPNNVSNRAWFKTKYLFTMTNKQPDPMIVSSRDQMKKESNKARGNLFPGKIPFPAVSLKNCLSETPEEAPSGIILSKLLENRTGVFSKSICGKVACLDFSKYNKLKTVAPPAAMPMKMEREYKVESQLVSVRKSGWGSNEFTVVFDSCFLVTYSMEHMFTVLKNIVVLVPSPRENCINLENRLIPRDMNSDGKSRVVRYGDTKYHIDCNVVRFFCALFVVYYTMQLEKDTVNCTNSAKPLDISLTRSFPTYSVDVDTFYCHGPSSDEFDRCTLVQNDDLSFLNYLYSTHFGPGYIEGDYSSITDIDTNMPNTLDSDISYPEEWLIHLYDDMPTESDSEIAEDIQINNEIPQDFIQSEIDLTKWWIDSYIESEFEGMKAAFPNKINLGDLAVSSAFENPLVDLLTECGFTGMENMVNVHPL